MTKFADAPLWGVPLTNLKSDGEIINHILELMPEVVKLQNILIEILDLELSKQLEVIIFEKLDFTNCTSQDEKIKVAKERETFWQEQLMTLECYGGLNKRAATSEIKI